MSFERLAFQTWMESHLGCRELDKWDSYRNALEAYRFTSAALPTAKDALNRDAANLFQKGLISFAAACSDLRSSNHSWAIVKLYYSLFYIIRSRLCSRHHGLVRSKAWYHFDLNSPKCSAIKLNGKKDRYRNDHECALHLYEDLFKISDKLISNTVDGLSSFSWLMELRNRMNYRVARFPDPIFSIGTQFVYGHLDASVLNEIILRNISDNEHILMFQPEHAWIGVPLKHLLAGYADLTARHQKTTLSEEQYIHTVKLVETLPLELQRFIDVKQIFA